MNKPSKLFSQFYSLDKLTNCYMIEIGLDEYTDIFSEWDPAPFKRREIDPDLKLYLEGCSQEIPLNYPIEIYFTIAHQVRNLVTEEEARDGLKNYFSFNIYFIKRDLKKTSIKILNYIFLGFVFLWVGISFSNLNIDNIYLTILFEGIVIWGWVLLWQAASLFFFRILELYNYYRIYKRLWNAEIIFAPGES